MSASRNLVLNLYKSLLRKGGQLSAYNFRMYALRRTRDAFREHMSLKDPAKIQLLVEKANGELEVIKRQVIIQNMYQTDKLVIENKPGKQMSRGGAKL